MIPVKATEVSLAIVGCINDKLLHIEAITPWTLLIAAVLIGIALDMLFKKRTKAFLTASVLFLYLIFALTLLPQRPNMDSRC